MIKKLSQDVDPSDTVKAPPKALDGLQFDSGDDDDSFYQGTAAPTAASTSANSPAATGSSTTSAAATAGTAAVSMTTPNTGTTSMTTSAPMATSTSVSTSSSGATTITMTPSTQYAPSPQSPMSSTGADLAAIADVNTDIVMRKMMLEEAKFELDREKSRHAMKMELKKEDFRQDQLREEEERNSKKQSEHWMKAYWRPAMGWLYMGINLFDFIVAPLLTMAMPVYLKSLGAAQVSYTQWQSLTLQNGGLIHLAFGAILGVTAWTRGQEKLAKMG